MSPNSQRIIVMDDNKSMRRDVGREVEGVSISEAFLLDLYTTMLRIRLFEERAAELVEAGEVNCPCHLYIGQEGIAAGICAALKKADYVWGGHRSHGHYLAKGGNLKSMMAELFGKATGCSEGRGGSMHLLAEEVNVLGTVPLVAATIPMAAGSALASKLRGDGFVSVAFFGDGATEEGHFHESVNMAAVYKLPVIFVCENNFYSSHMGLLERRAEDNIYKSAEAHGIPGVRLDGNNVVEIYQAAVKAVELARSGGGPTLLECRTYRWRGHVGHSWDMDVGVKRKDELQEWLPKDPVATVRTKLLGLGISENDLESIRQDIKSQVEDSVLFARESPFPENESLQKHVFYSKGEE
jgi:TPP-dependent pyruvate/acetoin dehydrogenase alpha subunit